eukprot:1060706-Pleurochrysis_carterae.AAC.1
MSARSGLSQQDLPTVRKLSHTKMLQLSQLLSVHAKQSSEFRVSGGRCIAVIQSHIFAVHRAIFLIAIYILGELIYDVKLMCGCYLPTRFVFRAIQAWQNMCSRCSVPNPVPLLTSSERDEAKAEAEALRATVDGMRQEIEKIRKDQARHCALMYTESVKRQSAHVRGSSKDRRSGPL